MRDAAQAWLSAAAVSMLEGPGVAFRGQIRKRAWWLGGAELM